jgi:hypothetical protein
LRMCRERSSRSSIKSRTASPPLREHQVGAAGHQAEHRRRRPRHGALRRLPETALDDGARVPIGSQTGCPQERGAQPLAFDAVLDPCERTGLSHSPVREFPGCRSRS